MLTDAIIFAVFCLAAAHVVADVNGVPTGTQLRWLFKPAVWLLYGVTLGRADFRKCKACREREAYLNSLFGEHK